MKRLTLCVLLVLAAGMALASTAAKDLYIPAVARSTGAFGTFWSSDVRLYNPTTAAVTATIAYLPSAAYAGDATSGTVDLGPLETVLLENVLETKLGIVTNTAGALHITAPENIYVESRTFTLKPSRVNDTYGQRIPGIPASQAVAAGESVDLLYIDNSGEFRTNFGIVDAGGAGVAYTLTAYDHNGSVLGTPYSGTVGANQWDQFNPLDKVGAGTQTNARVMFAVTSGTAMPYASQVDNVSGDPIFLDGTKIKVGGACGEGKVYGAAVQYVPGDAPWEWDQYINFPMVFIVDDHQLSSIQDPTPDLVDSGDEYPAVYMTTLSRKMMRLGLDTVFDPPLPFGDGEGVDVSYSVSYGVGSTVLLTALWHLQASFACPNTFSGLLDATVVAVDPDFSEFGGNYYWRFKGGVE